MSRVTKRKHVMKEMLDDDFELPKPNQQIVRVVGSRGNNLHEVEIAENVENYLVSMPTKFRRNVWVKRGDYVLVEPIEEGHKVKAEIVRILTSEHVKEFTKHNIWPKKFTKKREHVDDSLVDEDGLVQNVNRIQLVQIQNSRGDDDNDDQSSSCSSHSGSDNGSANFDQEKSKKN